MPTKIPPTSPDTTLPSPNQFTPLTPSVSGENPFVSGFSQSIEASVPNPGTPLSGGSNALQDQIVAGATSTAASSSGNTPTTPTPGSSNFIGPVPPSNFVRPVILFGTSGDQTNGTLTFYYKSTPFVVQFQAIPGNITESREATYQSVNIAKRMEPILIYQFSGFKKVSFDLKFGVWNNQDAKDLYTLMSLIRRSVIPTKRGTPMYCKLNLGGWLNNFDPLETGGFQIDDYTSDSLNCVISNYSLTPSVERFLDPNVFGQITGTGGIDWTREKVPAKMDIRLDVIVFSQVVWSGTKLIGQASSVETNSDATTLPSLKNDTSSADGNNPSTASLAQGLSQSDLETVPLLPRNIDTGTTQLVPQAVPVDPDNPNNALSENTPNIPGSGLPLLSSANEGSYNSSDPANYDDTFLS